MDTLDFEQFIISTLKRKVDSSAEYSEMFYMLVLRVLHMDVGVPKNFYYNVNSCSLQAGSLLHSLPPDTEIFCAKLVFPKLVAEISYCHSNISLHLRFTVSNIIEFQR